MASGAIIGVFGKQRSGKTLFSTLFTVDISNKYNIPLYNNIMLSADMCKNAKFINSLDEFPLNLEPKILLIDEIYNGCDSQDYKKLKDISIFLNTIGKQNTLLVFTSIDAAMVYNRLRSQLSVYIAVTSDHNYMYYRSINPDNLSFRDFKLPKTDEVFSKIKYDTKFIPLAFNWQMNSWHAKLKQWYKDNYNLNISLD
jgi:hypothetical protein